MTDQPQTIADVLSPIELLIFQAQERKTQREMKARQAARDALLAECEKQLREFRKFCELAFSAEVMEHFDFVIEPDPDRTVEPYATISYAHCLNRLRLQNTINGEYAVLLDRIKPDYSEVIRVHLINPYACKLQEQPAMQQENADRMLVELARVYNLRTLNTDFGEIQDY